MLVQQYRNYENGQTKWWHEGQPKPGAEWAPIKGHATYIKLGGKYAGKTSSEIKRVK